MDYGAPFTLNQDIVLNLTASQENGNLGNLAAGPASFPGTSSFAGAIQPAALTLPKGNVPTAVNVQRNPGTPVTGELYLMDISTIQGFLTVLQYVPNSLSVDYTTANIAGVYNNGAAGVGATLTTAAPNLPYESGVNATNGDQVIVSGQTDTTQNGLYIVSGVGVAVILTRSSVFDGSTPVPLGGVFTNEQDTFTTFVLKTFNGVFGTGSIVLHRAPLAYDVYTELGGASGVQLTAGALVNGGSLDTLFNAGQYNAAQDIVYAAVLLPPGGNENQTPDYNGSSFSVTMYYQALLAGV